MRLRFIGILAVLAMIMAFAVTPVAADHGGEQGLGEADCPEGTLFLHNFNQSELEVGLELTDGVFVRAVTEDGGGEATSVTIENTSDQTVTIAVKGGSDQEGNFVTLAPGETSDPITVTGNPTISNLSVCAGPFTPTLSLEKVITGGAPGDDEIDFDFTLSGDASGNFTTDANDPALLLASASGTFTITEPGESGWTLDNIACTGGTVVGTPTATSITVTVGTDQDVVCTFTNGKVVTQTVTQSLMLEKVVSSGDANTEFGFSFGASGTTPAALADTVSANDPAVLLSTTAGTYVIVESALANWNLTGINCVGNAADETPSVSIANRSVTVVVGAGENVTCTFTNAPSGTQSSGGGGGGASQTVRQGTLASSVPNTAMNSAPADQMPAAILGLLALGSLAYIARRNVVTSKHRS